MADGTRFSEVDLPEASDTVGVHNFDGGHADWALAWPNEWGDGTWSVASGSYDISAGAWGDDAIGAEDLDQLLRDNGYDGIEDLMSTRGASWGDELTVDVAMRQLNERFEVPNRVKGACQALSEIGRFMEARGGAEPGVAEALAAHVKEIDAECAAREETEVGPLEADGPEI